MQKEGDIINTRIKKLRKSLDLTQQKFSERIGSTQNVVANYETGRRNPSNSVINNICKTFNVNEEWLRTGEGEMFIKVSRDKRISDFIDNALSQESSSLMIQIGKFLKKWLWSLPKIMIQKLQQRVKVIKTLVTWKRHRNLHPLCQA